MANNDNIEFPQEWRELPKKERREKIRQLKRQLGERTATSKKITKYLVIFLLAAILLVGGWYLTRKSPEEMAFKQEVKSASLDGKVQEFPIEGADHVPPGTAVTYKTNPPTSGNHFPVAQVWGVYGDEIQDGAAVHGLEHGGIWISYKDIDDATKKILESIGRLNKDSVIVSPRKANDAKIAVASWGRMMKLDLADKALIQKFIDTYKNQGPEKLAN